MSFCKNINSPECDEYRKNQQACINAGGTTQWECIQTARDRYSRQVANYRDLVYPWTNFDWDYTRFIDNNYNSDATGATNEPTYNGLFKNTGAMLKIAKGYITDPNPSNNSISAQSDLTICSKVPEIDRASCEVINNIRKSYKSQTKPNLNNKNNFDKLKLDGQRSSSFYYQWGTCPTKDNKDNCKNKGFKWIDEKCYRPRYHFIKNEPGINWTNIDDNSFTQMANKFSGLIKGNLPSVVGDAVGIFPTQLGSVLFNKTQGDYISEPCDDILEHFNNNLGDGYFRLVTATLILIVCISILIYAFY